MNRRRNSYQYRQNHFVPAILFCALILAISGARAQQLGVDFSGYSDSGIGNFGYTLGYDFEVVTPVTVVALAAFDDNSGPGLPQAVPVGLWDQNGTLLASATIAKGMPPTLGMAKFFAATNITPITLQPGYYTVAAEDDWVQGGGQLPNFTVASGVSYLGYAQTPSPVNSFVYPTEQSASGTSIEALFGGNIVLQTEPPAITGQPQSVQTNLGSTVAFSVMASGSQPLTYQWIFDQTNLLADATNATLILTNITSMMTGVYSVIVSNPYGSVTSIPASLTSGNLAPILPDISTQTVNELTLLTVTNAATEPNPAAATDYRLVGPPMGMNIDSNGVITWTPSQIQSPGTNVVTTIATDSDPFDSVNPHLSATNNFIVIVREVNAMPVLSAIATQTVNVLSLLQVDNAAVDPDIHATLGYSLISFPAGAGISTNGVITWTPKASQSPSTNIFATVVSETDLYDLVNPHFMATNRFTVIVAPGLLLDSPGWDSDGGFEFSFDTEEGTTYIVQYSSNLVNWMPIEEVDGSGGMVTAIDPYADGNSEGFYRVIIGSP